MAGKTVNPTRMELTRLKGRLKTASRGHKLLKDKRDEQMRQFMILVRRSRQLRAQVEQALAACEKPITVAVMGCVVNGPGEAREADIGIAGGRGEGVLFSKGQILKKVPEDALFDELMQEIDRLEAARGARNT